MRNVVGTSVLNRFVDSNVPEKCPRQGAHLVMREPAGIPPLNGRRFIAVGSRCPPDDRGIEDRDDVRRLISIGIGQPILRATQDFENGPSFSLTPASSSASRRAASRGDSSGSIAPPMVAQSPESISRTRSTLPRSSLGTTAAEGRTRSSFPMRSRSLLMKGDIATEPRYWG